MRTRRADSSARASSISRITASMSTAPAFCSKCPVSTVSGSSTPRWYRSQISGPSRSAAALAQTAKEIAQVGHVAQQHALRMVVAGSVHGLRQVDDDRAIGCQQDVEFRQIAMHHTGTQHAHDLGQQRGVVGQSLLWREVTSLRRGAASPCSSVTSSMSSTP
jgi:hypothetical protein